MGSYSNKFLNMNTRIDEFSFIEKIKFFLETNEKLELYTNLNEIEDYDSLTIMAIVAWINDEYKIDCKTDQISQMNTVDEIFQFINSH
jgi:acyl carrier protein